MGSTSHADTALRIERKLGMVSEAEDGGERLGLGGGHEKCRGATSNFNKQMCGDGSAAGGIEDECGAGDQSWW
jgi:hypothetical protein